MKNNEFSSSPPVTPVNQVDASFFVDTGTNTFPSAPPSYNEAVAAERSQKCPPQPRLNVYVVPPPSSNMPPPPLMVTGGFTMEFGPNFAHIRCPYCYTDILTRTETELSCVAHLYCLLLAMMQCFLCSCLPYCVHSLRSIRHYCPNCNRYLGRYDP